MSLFRTASIIFGVARGTVKLDLTQLRHELHGKWHRVSHPHYCPCCHHSTNVLVVIIVVIVVVVVVVVILLFLMFVVFCLDSYCLSLVTLVFSSAMEKVPHCILEGAKEMYF
jgi:hypothetical protein